MRQVMQVQRNNVEIVVDKDKLKDIIGAGIYAKIVAELGAMAGAGDGGAMATTGKDDLLATMQVVPWWERRKIFAKYLDLQGGVKAVPWWRRVAVFRRHFGGKGGAWVYAGSRHLTVIYRGNAVLKVKDRDYS